jgi:hypothetical protein
MIVEGHGTYQYWSIVWHYVRTDLLLCINIFNKAVPTAKATEYNVE